jgi:hypothetical protein
LICGCTDTVQNLGYGLAFVSNTTLGLIELTIANIHCAVPWNLANHIPAHMHKTVVLMNTGRRPNFSAAVIQNTFINPRSR